MTAALDQVIPSPRHPLVDRDRMVTTAWYPWFRKIIDFVNGIANGELIVDGAISSRTLATGAVTADAIAANAITTEKLDVENLDVLNGTFGDLRTNNTGTRIQITDIDNEMRAYIDGVHVATIGADVIGHGAFIACTSPSEDWYPADFSNTSTTGGDLGTGGGALICQTIGGYCAQFTTTTTAAATAINAANVGVGGGHGQVGRSAALGGWSFYDVDGSGYGPFTGAHDAILFKATTIEPGDIVTDGAVIGRQLSDVLTEVHRSSGVNQPALGIYTRRYPILLEHVPPSMVGKSLAPWRETHDMAVINSLGEGCVNVCGLGGNIAVGDLIVTSAMPGKGMRQADDIVRSYTVARAREAVMFASETDCTQIACIYLCG